MKATVLGIVLLALAPFVAQADIIIFKSGSAKVGIIEDENPTQVKFREKDKVVTVMRSNIERVERATPEENDRLRLKWDEEKQRLDEQRKQRQEAEQKLEAERKAKGLVNVNGKWMSPAEAEAQRQRQILKDPQAQQEAASAVESPEAEEEIQLPDYLDHLDPDQKELVLEDLKRQQKIQVSAVQILRLGETDVALKGSVTNGSDITAGSVELEIECLDENGELLDVKTAMITTLRPGESSSYYLTLGVPSEMVKQAKGTVVDVRWQE